MKFKFSVVMPVYNVELYLEEAIESIINQTIGFTENIQLILINDGSPDNSDKICKKYKKQFPKNIVYYEQENQGVSAARNKGLEFVEGEYVNFCDSDDYFDLDVFEKVYRFFRKNKSQIDVVACRLKFFGTKNGYNHPLNRKYSSDKIVDIRNDYNFILASVSLSFIKKDLVKNIKFDLRIKYGEDLVVINSLIMNKQKYGVLKSATYNYRKRSGADSALDRSLYDPSWYINSLKFGYLNLFKLSQKKYDCVLRYLQFAVMYDLQWKIKNNICHNCLSKQQYDEHLSLIKQLLSYIEDDIILEQESIGPEYKILALKIKYGKDPDLYFKKGCLYYNNIKLYQFYNNKMFRINILEIKENHIYLEGQCFLFLDSKLVDVKFIDNLYREYNFEWYNIDHKVNYGVDGNLVSEFKGFKVKIPLKNVKSLRAMLYFKNENTRKLKINYGSFAKINFEVNKYFAFKKKIYTKCKDTILIQDSNFKKHLSFEMEYLKKLYKGKKYNIISYRFFYYILKKTQKKDIWLICDRPTEANDNGLALYKYVLKHDKNINVYFAISKKSKQYKEIKKIGKVVDYGSIRHKMLSLLAKNLISSHADDNIIFLFGNEQELIKDISNFNFVFLQHGITHNDLSSWLHKLNKNIKLFITSVNQEYRSIIKDYGYDKEQVKLTGFPRFDFLENNVTKKITLMPTWRSDIILKNLNNGIIREYNKNFIYSEYYEFYDRLINHKKLSNILENNGYILEFNVHPSLIQQTKDFKAEVKTSIINYDNNDFSKIFNESCLLITDYSSVAFDFAYLRKPVLYSQFDKEDFYKNHTLKKGYFEYERDGFGPVAYNLEDTVNKIIEYVENDCKIEKKYLNRINKFFKYNDKNNCKRVYEEIKNLNKKGK